MTSIITTNSSLNNITSTDTIVYTDDTLDIILPFLFGLFVACALGWMVFRYKVSTQQASHYAGSIYCCPESCFDVLTKFRNTRVAPAINDVIHKDTLNKSFNGSAKGIRNSQVSVVSNDLNSSHDNIRALINPATNANANANSNGRVFFISNGNGTGGGGGGGTRHEYPFRTLRRDTIVSSKAAPTGLFKFNPSTFITQFPGFHRQNSANDLL